MLLLNTGLMTPALAAKPDRFALVDAVLVTTIVYVLVVIPSCAVTTTVIVLLPKLSGILAEATPLAVVTPFILILAVASLRIAVTLVVVFMADTVDV